MKGGLNEFEEAWVKYMGYKWQQGCWWRPLGDQKYSMVFRGEIRYIIRCEVIKL